MVRADFRPRMATPRIRGAKQEGIPRWPQESSPWRRIVNSEPCLCGVVLSDPARPRILAVARGKDTAAAPKCLDRLSEEQRQQVRTHRVDMGSAYPAACAERLKYSSAVTDRFHVAKRFNEVVDGLRKNGSSAESVGEYAADETAFT